MAGFFEVELKVDAPPEYLWKVLIDFKSYSEWNPFITQIEGEPKIGSYITLQVKMDPNLDSIRLSKEMIVSLKENQHLSYDSHFLSSSFFNAIRWQTIRPTEDGKSSLYHSQQKISGLAAWPISHAFGDRISAGFEASSIAFKKRVEELYQSEKSD
jgi:hypothetical protein